MLHCYNSALSILYTHPSHELVTIVDLEVDIGQNVCVSVLTVVEPHLIVSTLFLPKGEASIKEQQ